VLAQVLVNQKASWLKEPLTYLVSDEMAAEMKIGCLLEIPFGKARVWGVFLGFIPSTTLLPEQLKYALDIASPEISLPQELVELANWLSQHYDCSIQEALGCVLGGPVLRNLQPAKRKTLSSQLGLQPSLLEEQPYLKPSLNAEQRSALEACWAAKERAHSILLHGVTGSGKTEVYLELVEKTLEQGQSAIVLVPEVALTAQAIQRYRGRLGPTVAILHSHLSDQQRRREWLSILQGNCRVALGTRSAVFAPVRNLGLIVIDEEHDTSYKQDGPPRYHARQVAQQRLILQNQVSPTPVPSLVVLGSATPSLETLWAAGFQQPSARPKIERVVMASRASGGFLPSVQFIDLKKEKLKRNHCLSSPLLQRLSEIRQLGRQAVLLYNRRGFSHYLQCEECGESVTCSNCSVSLVFHKAKNILRCHHCDLRQAPPEVCPSCQGIKLNYRGSGTERIELEIAERLPHLRVLRLDRDVTTTQSHAEILGLFENGQADVLLGTQMVAKGLDFPRVTLVGVLNADGGLNIPDFRSSERTFQLLAQVAGRAGRGDTPGHVLIQALNLDHPCLESVKTHDFEGYASQELELRKLAQYPPFVRLVRLVISGKDQAKVEKTADRLGQMFRQDLKNSQLGAQSYSPVLSGRPAGLPTYDDSEPIMIGPAPCPIEKLRGAYRYHCIFKARRVKELVEYIRNRLDKVNIPPDVRVIYDPDPQSLT
jgi:primosomal protein N' (replication factor Y) (superfamily II helicase)